MLDADNRAKKEQAEDRAGQHQTAAEALGVLDAVVHGVTHQMHQGIADLFNDGLVQLGFGAADDQVDIFAQFLADVANHPLEAVKGFTDLYHTQLQSAVAYFFHQP